MNDVGLVVLPAPFLTDQKRNAPLGILYLGAILKKASVSVTVTDLRGIKENSEHWLCRIPESRCYGISATSVEFPMAVKLAMLLKMRGAPVIIGGVHATVSSTGDVFDAVVKGEAEETVTRVVQDVLQNKLEKKYIGTTPNLDELPLPARELLPLDAWANTKIVKGYLGTTIIGSRGCPYECGFCLPLTTKVLMVDLTWKNIGDVKIGETVVSVEKHGRWKYCGGQVVKTLFREAMVYAIETDGGTVYSTEEHPWLMRGNKWQSISGIMEKAKYGACMNSTRATLRKVSTPVDFEETDDYRRGYIAGVTAGDGHVGLAYDKRGRGYSYYRVMITGDYIMQDRVVEYSKKLGLSLHSRGYSAGKNSMYKMDRMVACDRDGESRLIKEWVNNPLETDEYKRGFLAGVYDAEGAKHSPRFYNRSEELKTRIANYLACFGFRSIKEKGVESIRLLGGLSEIIRFFAFTKPTSAKRLNILGKQLKNSSRKIKSVSPIGVLPVANLMVSTGNFIADGFVTHNCSEAAIFGRRVRLRSPSLVAAEIAHLKINYGITGFRFHDDLLTLNIPWLEKLSDELEPLRIAFRCNAKVNTVTDKSLSLLKKAGCIDLGIGVESVYQPCLDLIRKHQTVKEATKAVELCHKYGVKSRVFLIVGLPGDTGDISGRTIAWLKRVVPDGIDLNTFVPLPGSPIWNKPDKYGLLYRDNFSLANLAMLRGLDEADDDFVVEYREGPSNAELKYHRRKLLEYIKEASMEVDD